MSDPDRVSAGRVLLDRLRGEPVDRGLVVERRTLAQIHAMDGLSSHTTGELQERLSRLSGSVWIGAARVEGFAILRELAGRTIGLRPFDVQLLAALCLHGGRMVQMRTGEGKTLAAALAAAAGSLGGERVHVLTVNDYLAARDAEWMGPLYAAAGLTVGVVQRGMSGAERRQAWAADITCATAREAGFDLLRDQLCLDLPQRVHAGWARAIVDEADSLMVDEARIPLVLAGHLGEAAASAVDVGRHVAALDSGLDFGLGRRLGRMAKRALERGRG